MSENQPTYAPERTPPRDDTQHPDDAAVDRFAAAMKAKLADARAKGRGGWDGPECNADTLSRMLRAHVDKGDPRDVANFCMFLHQRGEGIAPAPRAAVDEAMVERACEGYLLEAKRQNFNPSEAWARSKQARDWMRAALTAALRPET